MPKVVGYGNYVGLPPELEEESVMGEITQQLSVLGETYQLFLEIAIREDVERKKDLVAARRMLANQLSHLENLIASDSNKSIDTDTAREFRKRLSYLRTAIAYHQASWPAIMIDDDPASYRLTAREPAMAFRKFLEWGQHSLPDVA